MCSKTFLVSYIGNLSVVGIPHNDLEAWYNGNHTLINGSFIVTFSQIHISMPIVITMIMAMMAIAIVDFTVPSCSSPKGGSRCSVKICSSVVVYYWVAAAVF